MLHAILISLALAGPAVFVEAPDELAPLATRVRAAAAGDYTFAHELVGLDRHPGPVRVVLAPERSELAARAPSWVAGYAIGPLDTIVLFPGRVPSYPDRTLEVLVRHELAHLMVDEAAGGARLPRWFAEGLATVAAREWGIEDAARYALAVIGRDPRSTADLDSAFAAGGGQARRAYALSANFVRHLLERHGDDTAARILAGVRSGASFPEAFRRATGVSLSAAERRYFGREAFWRTWVPFLTSTTALWMLVTLLALLAIRARRRRTEEIRARWAAEEEAIRRAWTPPDPPAHDDDEHTWN